MGNVIRLSNATDTQHNHTRCRVQFFSDPSNGFDSGAPIVAHQDFGHIIGVQTQKNLGSASGTFTITVKKSKEMGPKSFLELWKDPEGVWVLIQFVVNGVQVDTMLGIIDVINEDTTRAGAGERSENYQIVGRCFGKVYETTELFVNLYGTRGIRSAGAYGASGLTDLKFGVPTKIIRFLNEVWVKNEGVTDKQWVLPTSLQSKFQSKFGGGSSFGDALQFYGDVMSAQRHGIADALALSAPDSNGVKLWDAMQQYSNGVLNELFTDLADPSGNGKFTGLKPALYLRERPFPTFRQLAGDTKNGSLSSDINAGVDRRFWEALPTVVLTKDLVARRALSKGGASNRYNYWMLTTSVTGSAGFSLAEVLTKGVDGVPYGSPGALPVINTLSMQRYGLRRWEQSSNFIPFYKDVSAAGNDAQNQELKAKMTKEGFIRLSAMWTKMIHDWYAIAPGQLSGSISTTRVMPEIRIGTRVVEERDEGRVEYYVEGVSHSWTYPNAGSTTIMLTRGEYQNRSLLREYYEEAVFGRDDAIVAARTAETLAFVDEVIGYEGGSPEVYQDPTSTAGEAALESEKEQVADDVDDPSLAPAISSGMIKGLRPPDPRLGDAENLPWDGSNLDTDEPILAEEALLRGDDIVIPPGNIG